MGKCYHCGKDHVEHSRYANFCIDCGKPKVVKWDVLELLDVLDYMELLEKGFHERFWEWFIHKYNPHNDTYVELSFSEFDNVHILGIELNETNKQIQADLKKIQKEFNIDDDCVLMWVSW